MYLLVKASVDSNYQGLHAPDLLVVHLNSRRPFMERCSEVAGRNASEDPKPAKIAFPDSQARWCGYDEQLEEYDFYQTLLEKEVVLVNTLPEALSPFNKDNRVPGDFTHLAFRVSDPGSCYWEANLKNTTYIMETALVTLDEIDELPVFEGTELDLEQDASCGFGR